MEHSQTSGAIPAGYCQCGCGQLTALAKMTSNREGVVKGQPNRFFGRHGSRQPRKKITITERFWKHTERREPEECWPWTGSLLDGYGELRSGYGADRVRWLAHRYSYFLHTGTDPGTACCCHSCDNPLCVNPAHLWLGTIAENNRDRTRKGRDGRGAARGERAPKAKLKERDIPDIRRQMASGATNKELAAHYGVDPSTISNIRSGKAWKHVP